MDHCGQPVSSGLVWFGSLVWLQRAVLFPVHKRHLNAIISRVQDIYNSVCTILHQCAG